MRRRIHAAVMVVIAGLVAVPFWAIARDQTPAKSALRQDRVVAGSPKDFMEVRHVVLKGSNEEIGRALAALGKDRFKLEPTPSTDPLRTRAQQRYLTKNYPILLDRMRGVSKAFGKPLDDSNLDFGGLGYLFPGGGCSVVHLPPGVTADGKGLVSRNYDFGTGTIDGRRAAKDELAATARPYLLELHPDRGYSSLSMCAYDLLSGVLDGINSEGLTVALLADDELNAKFKMEPAMDSGVGLGVQQVLRMLLDTCATVEEAKEALLTTKQFYEFIPCHYFVADRHGKAFVWEYSQAHNREYIIENAGKPLVTTNFSLHRYLEDNGPPSAKKAKNVCPRYCTLCERLAAPEAKVSVDFLKQSHKEVDAHWPGGPLRPTVRTLWHALYVPERRSVQISYYLGDEKDPTGDKSQVRRSEYMEFGLGK